MDISFIEQVKANADYGDRSDGQLEEAEVVELHARVQEGLATTNGDAGTIEVSTRQLALLLAAVR